MARFSSRVVAEITEERHGLQKVLFDDNSTGYALVSVCGTLQTGDEVVVNTTAVDLNLGTGGHHVVHWIANKRSQTEQRQGEILKARYLSEQTEVDPYVTVRQDLSGARVLLCALHSQLGAAAIGANSKTLGYVMTDQAALPLALSDLLADLKKAKMNMADFRNCKLSCADLRGIRGRYAIWDGSDWWNAMLDEDLAKVLEKKWGKPSGD